jgi:hypothetical protein
MLHQARHQYLQFFSRLAAVFAQEVGYFWFVAPVRLTYKLLFF